MTHGLTDAGAGASHEGMALGPPADQVVISALLRAARGGYSHAIRARLAAGGLTDMPRNGPHVLGGMVNQGGRPGSVPSIPNWPS